MNAAGSTAATSSQRSGAETRASGDRPDRVGARDRPVAGVLAEVDEDADPVGDAPGRRGDALVADPPLDLLGERLREPAHVRERQLGPDRRQDVQPCRARGLRERREPELVHHLAHDERDLAHERPLPVARRVEVDQQVVGPLDLGHPRVPGVQLDAAEVRDPGERRRVVDAPRRRSSGRSGTTPAPRRRSPGASRVRASGGRTRRRRRSGTASCGTGAGGGAAGRTRQTSR